MYRKKVWFLFEKDKLLLSQKSGHNTYIFNVAFTLNKRTQPQVYEQNTNSQCKFWNK
jgi:hypothetical protein